MTPVEIFISYRRDDAAGYARAIGAELVRRFGAERVFIDVDDIGAGQTFAEVIRRAVGESKVLLVLMGPRWCGEREGRPARILDADDFVRLEVAQALAQGLRVIPVLLDGAAMPLAAQLPDELRPLLGRNAFELVNARFAADIERLATLLGAPAAPPAPSTPAVPTSRPLVVGLLAAALLGITLAAAWVWLRPARVVVEGAAHTASPSSIARAAINGEWQADVVYDWPNARYLERFSIGGEANDLVGSASFLGVPRGLLEGRVEGDALGFVTRTTEMPSGAVAVHRYRARLVGEALQFTMQTEGGSSDHVPLSFVARRMPQRPAAGPPASAAGKP